MEKKPLHFFLNSKTKGALAGKIILMLLIPYAYLMLCGLIFDMLLKWYFMTTFIFISLIVLYILAIVLSVIAVKNYRSGKRSAKKEYDGDLEEIEIED